MISSLMGTFLGSGLGGNNEGAGAMGSGIGGLLSNFAGTGNSPGPGSNNPFMSMLSIGQSLFGGGGGGIPGLSPQTPAQPAGPSPSIADYTDETAPSTIFPPLFKPSTGAPVAFAGNKNRQIQARRRRQRQRQIQAQRQRKIQAQKQRQRRIQAQRQRQTQNQRRWKGKLKPWEDGGGTVLSAEDYEDMFRESTKEQQRLNRELQRARRVEQMEKQKLQAINAQINRENNRLNGNANGWQGATKRPPINLRPPTPVGLVNNKIPPIILPPALRGKIGKGASAADLEADYDDAIDMRLTQIRRKPLPFAGYASPWWRRHSRQSRQNRARRRMRAHVFYDEPSSSRVVPPSASFNSKKAQQKRITNALDSLSNAFNSWMVPPSPMTMPQPPAPSPYQPYQSNPFMMPINIPAQPPAPPPLQNDIQSDSAPVSPFFSQFVPQQFLGFLNPPQPMSSSAQSNPVANLFNQFAPPVKGVTAAPFEVPTLAPPPSPTTPSPKLLAHNTARMFKEIVTLNDVYGGGKNSDFSSVQTLMESFFESVSSSNKPGVGTATTSHDQPYTALQPQFDGTELGANRPLTNKLFESDMVLTVEQMKAVVLGTQDYKAGSWIRRKRKVILGHQYRWPRKPIPYRFKGNDLQWMQTIRTALRKWEGETCVRWKENAPGKDHIIFFRGAGCYSSVGRVGGQQTISIGYGCEDVGIVQHEVGHSLGFWHEQSRYDRDKYIILRKEWLLRGTDGNFERRTEQEIESMGLPYDIGSVMHYGQNAFTKDWDHATIETVDRKFQRTMGQRDQPSFIDVKQVNRLYCNERTCGGELTATSAWQNLEYKGKRKCFWRVRSTNNARIRMIFSEIRYRCETTCHAFIEVKANSDYQQTGFRLCCFEDREVHFVSEQPEVLFFSDSIALDYEVSFKLRYIQDNGVLPPPTLPPPTSTWVPGVENRGFRGQVYTGGPIENFILNAIPRIRDTRRPLESVASIAAEYGLATLFGIAHNKK
ncbi:hypothetical protein WR25_19127 [Diploscapter pachys]|uniref:Metalloendopeptidase n=1 Tax=Diploscapter pachys TaxID=2018661 RepID=A0A2A2L380_9BILA|nr:hypothetical protein WR25_19127 [Diploscapter pachys]